MILNYNAEDLSNKLTSNTAKKLSVYLLNSEQQFIDHPKESYRFSFELHDPHYWSEDFSIDQQMNANAFFDVMTRINPLTA